MSADDEKKHAELSELLGLLKTHRDALAEASGWNSAHVDEVLIAARKARDKLATKPAEADH